ncbi:uncharacterized protein N7506_000211 [Penicillium brevicompactum]|uniref:uncharacterized protein n=1 Tax=Penicillium brevicompactum TaxID=5074 RepID=UPI002541D5CD|nr:uncharacterized protein N7506_000211 [Penicillium brevicompactum]KAJ5346958.1 hypothetical protein N7506_000211 [Penicillium brevicompactum]
MARKSKKWTEVLLRKAIGDAIYSRYLQNQPIDREAIKTKYLNKNPNQADFIRAFVDSYASQLELMSRSDNRIEIEGSAQVQSIPLPIPTLSQRSQGQAQHPVSSDRGQHSHGRLDAALDNFEAASLVIDSDIGRIYNSRLQEFKDHLAGNLHRRETGTSQSFPSLEIQWQFLSFIEDQREEAMNDVLNEHAILVSPLLEGLGYSLPSQCMLLGNIVSGNELSDCRVMLNANIPFSAFVCGVQGSGKSHTTACMIENCSMSLPELGTLNQSISTLVLQFDEYTSTTSSQPSEAAFLASALPQYAHEQPVPLRVLVSPTNLSNLRGMYSQIPNIEIQPFKIHPKHLNISMMLSLMSVSQSGGIPLYMAQVARILREMAMESGGYFDYSDFRSRLNKLKLGRSQTPFLYQRLDLLDSYLDHSGTGTSDYFIDGGVTILDLSCPFVDQGTACILFRIAIDLFLYAHPSRGKMIVADEAHKYMTDTFAAKALIETFLTIIRQQRHLGVRIIISTQEPTISPQLIDLCSLTIIHRFTSPEWYKTIEKHVPMGGELAPHQADSARKGLSRVARLRTGEAIVFASSAHLVGEDGNIMNTQHETFKVMIRKRITWDGGRSIVCIR